VTDLPRLPQGAEAREAVTPKADDAARWSSATAALTNFWGERDTTVVRYNVHQGSAGLNHWPRVIEAFGFVPGGLRLSESCAGLAAAYRVHNVT